MTAILWFAYGLLLLTFLYVLYRSIFDKDSPKTEGSRSVRHRASEPIKAQIRELAEIAWKTEEAKRIPHFLLTPSDFESRPSPDKVVEVLLRHAKRVAPGFTVLQTVPRMVRADFPDDMPGEIRFEPGGDITIYVGAQFYRDIAATQAILAHEVCHYILESSNFRQPTTYWNERYTDLCMFVCGFGDIYLAGYQGNLAVGGYLVRHRLGYLSDADYQLARQYVLQLRQSNELPLPGKGYG